jgi:uncharacterized membrane protein
MGVTRTIEQIARGIEVLGITTLVSGLAIAVVRAANILIHSRSGEGAYRTVRTVFGRSILLGLEFLVAADIIRTIAVEPSLENVGVLGLIVLIRESTACRHVAASGRSPDPIRLTLVDL